MNRDAGAQLLKVATFPEMVPEKQTVPALAPPTEENDPPLHVRVTLASVISPLLTVVVRVNKPRPHPLMAPV